MASAVAQFAAKKIFKESLSNKSGLEDVYFEQVPATRLDGNPNQKFKKVRKALPPGLTDHDAKILTKVKRRAYRLDMSFGSFMGIKFGWGSIIGIVPFIGDFADALLAMMVIRTAKGIEGGLPSNVLLNMYIWVFIDLIVGLTPFIGDLFDCVILANTRNAKLLEDHLRKTGQQSLKRRGLPIPDVDPSKPSEFDRFHSEVSTSPGHTAQTSGVAEPVTPTRPQEARVHDSRQKKSSGGFFGFGGKKSKPADIESGTGPSGQAHASKGSRRG
ncbi:hypothetical protein F5Y18DRAFT_379426 [Xylariaceae sp. FL1019]|nr:hypothetical protein F5Y18DRAFT_379426 [Xylariaceae sp. FL1019]